MKKVFAIAAVALAAVLGLAGCQPKPPTVTYTTANLVSVKWTLGCESMPTYDGGTVKAQVTNWRSTDIEYRITYYTYDTSTGMTYQRDLTRQLVVGGTSTIHDLLGVTTSNGPTHPLYATGFLVEIVRTRTGSGPWVAQSPPLDGGTLTQGTCAA